MQPEFGCPTRRRSRVQLDLPFRSTTTFWLGTHKPAWLARTDVPLFVSRRSLAGMKRLPRATCRWALDSGGFTELAMHGRWTVSPKQYVDEVRRFKDEIGGLAWAAPQDWMCEPSVIHGQAATPLTPAFKGTGLSVEHHQTLTTLNFITLKNLAPDLPFIPVLQGWTLYDYLRHAEHYEQVGVRLREEPVVGVGTICRRQSSVSASLVFGQLHADGLHNLHAFGLKMQGLDLAGKYLASADSLAWSYDARRSDPLPGHTHKSCANCLEYAIRWREHLLSAIDHAPQRC